MKESAKTHPPEGLVLSDTLKALRRLRSLTVVETADRMHINPRTYARFASGTTRLNMDYIQRFARAVDCDPHAIVTAVAIGSPAFAVQCANNQLSSILTVGLQDLSAALGDDLKYLTARDVVEVCRPMFEALTHRALAARDAAAANRARLSPPR